MRLCFSDAQWDPRELPAPYDVVLGVSATVSLTSDDGRLVYEEELFPVVELALAIDDWLNSGFGRWEDFSFESVESDEFGLLWCRAEGNGWRLGALDQDFPDATIYESERVATTLTRFTQDVDGWLAASIGRSLSSVRI